MDILNWNLLIIILCFILRSLIQSSSLNNTANCAQVVQSLLLEDNIVMELWGVLRLFVIVSSLSIESYWSVNIYIKYLYNMHILIKYHYQIIITIEYSLQMLIFTCFTDFYGLLWFVMFVCLLLFYTFVKFLLI